MLFQHSIPRNFLLEVSSLLEDNRMFVGGKWIPASSGESTEVVNPATQEIIATVPNAIELDVNAAVDAATVAFRSWREMNPTARGELLNRWADLCEEHSSELQLLESLEVGQPGFKFSPAPASIRYTAGLADKLEGTSLPTTNLDQIALTLRDPYGPVAIIIPWNGPGLALPKRAAAPLIAGNTLVIKPAAEAPLTVLYLALLAQKAGIPDGVINVVTGSGRGVGEPLVSHPNIRRVSFTGSTTTGTRIMELAASHQIPSTLELGGKSPQIVLHDADLEKAIPQLVAGITLNAGQACIAGSRVLVDRRIESEVIARLQYELAKVEVGPWYESPNMGPLITKDQQDRVLNYIEIGQQEGAILAYGGQKIVGGKYDTGYYIEPTLFIDVRPEMRIAQDEIFGPVVVVMSFDSDEEALEIANGTDFGLASTVWTRDVSRAVNFARRVEAGLVSINSFMGAGGIGVPAGGFKSSGYGRTSSTESPLEWTQTKAVVFGR